MAGRQQRDINGPWSLRQVAATSGLSTRTITRLTDLGWLTAPYSFSDICVARVGSALLDAPRSPGVTSLQALASHRIRNDEAISLARTTARASAKSEPPPESRWLIVGLDNATIADNPFELAQQFHERTTGALVLPLGRWALEALHAAERGTPTSARGAEQ